MNMAGFYDESISNGLGWRAVLFVSGCPHNCPGCQNKMAQDYNYGEKFDKQKIIDRICDNSLLKGITISGGEPLCKENVGEVLGFIRDVKKVRPNFNVWCYSGYTIEELKNRNDEITNQALNEIDVLVDGRFVIEKKDPTLKFRGSSNQRILDVHKCIQENRIVQIAI
ncbi:MAG: anaerobic ribonucleoside-triphosphate reductase activating protein [Clostridia bacterium]|nr:anaerobic ribonucleoside-triphosphate reductase activating protein [Clostridia bacterium]